MTENIKKILILFDENEEAVESLSGVNNIEEAVSILKNYGIELTNDEFLEMVREVNQDELSEDMLEMVAGGGFLKSAWKVVKDFFKGFLDAM